MKWEEKLKNRVVTRKINDRIDEVLCHKDNELICHIEEMDKGLLHVIFYTGQKEHHFSLNSKSEINILEQ